MALSPCQRCDQRFKGDAISVYVTRFDGDEVENYRYVLCPTCVELVMLEVRCRACYRDGDGDWTYDGPTDEPEPRLRPSEQRETRRGRRNGR